MGKKSSGIYQGPDERWDVDKYDHGVRLRARFESFEEAESWLTRQLEIRRHERVHGARPRITFNEAAGRFIEENADLASIESYVYHLKPVIPLLGHLLIEQVHMGVLQPFIEARLAQGISHKTINLSLAAVRRILNLSARVWRDKATGQPWLSVAPLLSMLPLAGHQEQPRPITWDEQKKLLQELPPHLRDMTLFDLNTGVRDDVVCNLQWDWEIPVPELGVSFFEVPKGFVKGRRQSRVIVSNSVAQQVIERARGKHPTHVFVMKWRHHPLGPIQTMNNSAWQSARARAGLSDVRVHDLRHTTGARLREAGVPERTISAILWHGATTMTGHYTRAWLMELHEALEKITTPAHAWNKTLHTLKAEHLARKTAQAATAATTSSFDLPR